MCICIVTSGLGKGPFRNSLESSSRHIAAPEVAGEISPCAFFLSMMARALRVVSAHGRGAFWSLPEPSGAFRSSFRVELQGMRRRQRRHCRRQLPSHVATGSGGHHHGFNFFSIYCKDYSLWGRRVIMQRWPFGAMRNLFSSSIISSDMDLAILAPLHSRKNRAAPSRSSIHARWMPIQILEPAPKGCRADF